jgi:hypothetical protein
VVRRLYTPHTENPAAPSIDDHAGTRNLLKCAASTRAPL